MSKAGTTPRRQSLIGDCAAAFVLLSRLPTGWHQFPADNPPNFTSALWAFPVVGLVIGSATGLTLSGAAALALPPLVAAALAIFVSLLLSGAMHEDGLADMADGFGGGHDAESKIRIMHDSRIGTYGVLGLTLTVAIRIGLYMTCLGIFSGWDLVLFMAVLQAAGRFQPVVQLAAFRVSPHASLAQLTGRPGAARLAVAAVICLLPMIWLLGPVVSASMIIPALALAIWTGQLATRHVEGLTGDVMGATVVLAEIIMLLCWASVGGMMPA